MPNLCPRCGNVIEYPYCLSDFHDRPSQNVVVRNLTDLLERINYPPFQ